MTALNRFKDTPWRVEESPGELLVVSSRNIIVASISTEDSPSLEADRRHAYAIAALPMVIEKSRAFLGALADPVKQLDEDELLRCANELEAALVAADVPEVENASNNVDKVPTSGGAKNPVRKS